MITFRSFNRRLTNILAGMNWIVGCAAQDLCEQWQGPGGSSGCMAQVLQARFLKCKLGYKHRKGGLGKALSVLRRKKAAAL